MPEQSQGEKLGSHYQERNWGPQHSKGEERERELQSIHSDFNFCIHDSDPYGDMYL